MSKLETSDKYNISKAYDGSLLISLICLSGFQVVMHRREKKRTHLSFILVDQIVYSFHNQNILFEEINYEKNKLIHEKQVKCMEMMINFVKSIGIEITFRTESNKKNVKNIFPKIFSLILKEKTIQVHDLKRIGEYYLKLFHSNFALNEEKKILITPEMIINSIHLCENEDIKYLLRIIQNDFQINEKRNYCIEQKLSHQQQIHLQQQIQNYVQIHNIPIQYFQYFPNFYGYPMMNQPYLINNIQMKSIQQEDENFNIELDFFKIETDSLVLYVNYFGVCNRQIDRLLEQK